MTLRAVVGDQACCVGAGCGGDRSHRVVGDDLALELTGARVHHARNLAAHDDAATRHASDGNTGRPDAEQARHVSPERLLERRAVAVDAVQVGV